MTSAPISPNNRLTSPPATMMPRSRMRSPCERIAADPPSGAATTAGSARQRGSSRPRRGQACGNRRAGRRRRNIRSAHSRVHPGDQFGIGDRAYRVEMFGGQDPRRRQHRGDRHPLRLSGGHQVLHGLVGEQRRDQAPIWGQAARRAPTRRIPGLEILPALPTSGAGRATAAAPSRRAGRSRPGTEGSGRCPGFLDGPASRRFRAGRRRLGRPPRMPGRAP